MWILTVFAALLLTALQTHAQDGLQQCVACHSGSAAQAKLDLTTRENAIKGGKSGTALVPGDAAGSLLYRMMHEKKMPPGQPASAKELEAMRKWIDSGAEWKTALGVKRAGPDWWALQRVVRPAAPNTRDAAWIANPIDAFVLAGLEKKGLRPAAAADRTTLIRRITYDLHGMPPTPGEIDAFVSDSREDAYERLIDRLLASPRYGERWGRHWLDIARYSESQGYERDKIRDNAWRYRDYVIGAFNNDMPYTRFVKEQIAGDVIAPVTREGIVATGFLVAGPWDEVGANQASILMKSRVREEELEDTISAVAQSFLGLTVNCARCHDHKFDPIQQRDYYRMKAAFEGVHHGDREILTPDEKKARERREAPIRARLARMEREVVELQRAEPVKGVQPVARWTFDLDARDEVSLWSGVLPKDSVIANGRLRLKGASFRTAPITKDIGEKTMEVWLILDKPNQRSRIFGLEGSGLVSPRERISDVMMLGSLRRGKWGTVSEHEYRSTTPDGVVEDSAKDQPVHIAIVYGRDGTITIYRNGVAVGNTLPEENAGMGRLQTFLAKESRIVFEPFQGELEEARLYDRALTPEEIAASFRNGAAPPARVTDEKRERREALLAEIAAGEAELRAAPAVDLAYAANSARPGATFLLTRGDPANPKERVAAGGLSGVKTISGDFGLPPNAPEWERRIKLAEWITHPDNPLMARVMVNRVWHYHFGRGIVGTPNDFGYNGERPSHPELLDWLATEFSQGGYSLKKLHKVILLSNTYRQSTAYSAAAAAVDSENRLLWRFSPRRVEAEAARDAMLAAAGELNEAHGGPGFRPFTVFINNSHFYTLKDEEAAEQQRRTVYRINVLSAKSPLLDSLDCPDPASKMPARAVTTTPLQALGLMNNSFVQRMSRKLAERVAREAGSDVSAQVRLAWRLALGRAPKAEELSRASVLGRSEGMESVAWVLFNSSEFLYTR